MKEISIIKKIALGFGFSPNLPLLLSELKTLAVQFNAEVYLIHAGLRTEDNHENLERFLARYSYSEVTYHIVYEEGNPDEVIAKFCHDNLIDLIVVGAVMKEKLRDFLFGSVARKLARAAEKSILLIPNPASPPAKVNKMIISVEDKNSLKTIHKGLEFAKIFKPEKLFFVKESVVKGSRYGLSRYLSEKDFHKVHETILKQETEFVEKLIDSSQQIEFDYSIKIVFGHSGKGIVEFAEQIGCDLMIDHYPEKKSTLLDKLFPSDVEYLLLDLPCKLLLIN